MFTLSDNSWTRITTSLYPATRRVNLLRLTKEDTKGAEVAASSVLKTHYSSPNGTVRLSQASGGPKLPLKLGMSI